VKYSSEQTYYILEVILDLDTSVFPSQTYFIWGIVLDWYLPECKTLYSGKYVIILGAYLSETRNLMDKFSHV